MADNKEGHSLISQVQILAQPLDSFVTSLSLPNLSEPNVLICKVESSFFSSQVLKWDIQYVLCPVSGTDS